ncbi:hypothetical protein STSP_10760 [Streptomyces jeddahensis]|uniref:Transposase IS701-like DDE domain-containing protein n=1 Tax=Streptomyces jeddahensis TaxID=1716141 RepID=A0A177HY25_9ACTN|nr:hypothetical protein STSP_10760 [Streptomyces jeddahensis]
MIPGRDERRPPLIIVVVTQQENTAAVEAMVSVERWRAGLDALLGRCAPQFRRIESRLRAKSLVEAMMAHVTRRNCWTLAEAAGEPNPYRFQHLLSRARWDDAAVRAEVRSAVWEGLSTGNGVKVLVVDDDKGATEELDGGRLDRKLCRSTRVTLRFSFSTSSKKIGAPPIHRIGSGQTGPTPSPRTSVHSAGRCGPHQPPRLWRAPTCPPKTSQSACATRPTTPGCCASGLLKAPPHAASNP